MTHNSLYSIPILFLKDCTKQLYDIKKNKLDVDIDTRNYALKNNIYSLITVPKKFDEYRLLLNFLYLLESLNISIDEKISEDIKNRKITIEQLYSYYNGLHINPRIYECLKKLGIYSIDQIQDININVKYKKEGNSYIPEKYSPSSYLFVSDSELSNDKLQKIFKSGYTIILNTKDVNYNIPCYYNKDYKKMEHEICIFNNFYNFYADLSFDQLARISYENKECENYFEKFYGFKGVSLKEGIVPYPHQIRTILFMKYREGNPVHGINGGMLHLAMGLGKTFISLLYCMLNKNEEKSRVGGNNLIICSKTILNVWQENIDKFFRKNSISVYIMNNDFNKNAKNVSRSSLQSYDFVITTYDGVVKSFRDKFGKQLNEKLQKDTEYSFSHDPSKFPINISGYDLIHYIEWERIIADESQLLSDPKTQRVVAMKNLTAKHKWLLTGTPVRNKHTDIYTQFQVLGLSDPTMTARLWKISLDYFNSEITPLILSLDYEKANIKLPDKNDIIVTVDFNDYEKIMYRDLHVKYMKLYQEMKIKSHDRDKTGMLLKHLGLMREFCISPVIASLDSEKRIGSKMKEILKLIGELKGEKIIVFSSYVVGLEELERCLALKLPKIKYVKMTGATDNREAIVSKFKTDPDVQLFLMTYKTGSEGLTLTEAKHCICIEPWWNRAVVDQAKARCWRIGQDKEVKMYNFLMNSSIEIGIFKICYDKKGIADMYTKGGEFVGNPSKITEMLFEYMHMTSSNYEEIIPETESKFHQELESSQDYLEIKKEFDESIKLKEKKKKK